MAKALLLILILIKTAFGTSFYERPFAESLKSSPYMVRGKIGKATVDAAKVADGTELVFTFYDFRIADVLKGDIRPGTIKIREIGGERNGIGMSVSGAAQFSSGEEVVVFLDAPINEAYPVRGMMMGKFGIQKGADGKEYLRGPGLGSHATETQWSLDAVKELIQKQKDELESQPAAIQNANTPANKTSNPGTTATGGAVVRESDKNSNSAQMAENTSGESSEVISNEVGGTRLKERRVPSIWVVAAGIITGIYFYLRTKRQREGK